MAIGQVASLLFMVVLAKLRCSDRVFRACLAHVSREIRAWFARGSCVRSARVLCVFYAWFARVSSQLAELLGALGSSARL